MHSARGLFVTILSWVALHMLPSLALAQSAGFELALSGAPHAISGGELRLAAIAYEVEGLAGLTAREGLELAAELRQRRGDAEVTLTTARVRTGAGGHAELALRVPQEVSGSCMLAIEVRRPGQPGRTFEQPVWLAPGNELVLRTDRERYEPGETVHAWGLVRAADGRPRPDRPARVQLLHEGRPIAAMDVRSRASGALVADLALPAALRPGAYVVQADVEGLGSASAVVRILERTTERLAAGVVLDTPIVSPGGLVRGHVHVSTPSGSPVRGADVEVWLLEGEEPVRARTDRDGDAMFEGRVPAFLAGDRADRVLRARVVHGAYGTLEVRETFVVARSVWSVQAQAENGGLVPEVASRVFLSVRDPRGAPARVGSDVSVRGLGVGAAVVQVDEHGLAQIDVRLPRGAATTMSGGPCGGQLATSLEVEVRARPISTVSVCVPVLVDAGLSITTLRPVAELGGRVEFTLGRRAGSQRPVLVELVSSTGRVAGTTWMAATANRGSIDLPVSESGGVWTLRALPIAAADDRRPLDRPGATTLLPGAAVHLLVRPADAFEVTVQPDAALRRVRETAQVTVRASHPVEAGTAWTSLLIRDEAMLSGEAPWAMHALEGELRLAMARPFEPAHERFVRAALAVQTPVDLRLPPPPPLVEHPWGGEAAQPAGHSLLRDPIALREAYLRQRVGSMMVQLESLVGEVASDPTGRARYFTRSGSRVDFAPDVLARLSNDRGMAWTTLGDAPLTIAQLRSADPAFTFDNVARRVTRTRLVTLLAALSAYLDPESLAAQRASANEPSERWLARLVQLGVLEPEQLIDGWGRPFALHRVRSGRPLVIVSDRALDVEVSSSGPDGALGSADDVRDPFARVLPRDTLYAVASGEDQLLDAFSRIAPGPQVLAAMLRAFQTLSLAANEQAQQSLVTSTITEAAEMPVDMMEAAPMMEPEAVGGGAFAMPSAAPAPPPSAQGMLRAAERTAANHDRDRMMDVDDASARDEAAPAEPNVFAAVSALIRREFPATLLFVGEVALDASGQATIPVELRDALTTYRLEAIAWTQSGWVASGRGALRVDQAAVIDAPVPAVAVVGDVLRLPLRVQNRTNEVLPVRVQVIADGLEARVPPATSIEVGARDAAEAIVEVTLPAVGAGVLRVQVMNPAGQPYDTVERPIRVVGDLRRVREQRVALIEGSGEVGVTVPAGAQPRGPMTLSVALSGRIFGDPLEWRDGDRTHAAWALAMEGSALPDELVEELVARVPQNSDWGDARFVFQGGDRGSLARIFGALWAEPRLTDDDARAILRVLSGAPYEVPDGLRGRIPAPQVMAPVEVLLAMLPALRSPARPGLRGLLDEAVQRIGAEAWNQSARDVEATASNLLLAAVLANSSASEAGRAAELMRRVERDIVRVDDLAWIELDESSLEPRVAPSALAVLAYLGLGRRAEALPFVRMLASVARGAPRWPLPVRALAAGAVSRLVPPLTGPRRVEVSLNGRPIETREVDHVVLATLPEAQPGSQTVRVTLSEGAVALATLDTAYGVAWDSPHADLPVEIAWEGDPGARDTRSTEVLVVRNRSPRVLVRPVVEVQLPAGAELDEATRARLGTRLLAPPVEDGNLLRLELRPLPPGSALRLAIPARWSVGGGLHGAGVAVWDDAHPERGLAVPVAVRASQVRTIADRGPERPPPEDSVPTVPMPRPDPMPYDLVPSLAEGLR